MEYVMVVLDSKKKFKEKDRAKSKKQNIIGKNIKAFIFIKYQYQQQKKCKFNT